MDRILFLLNVPAHLTRDNRPDVAVMVKTMLLEDGDLYVSLPGVYESTNRDIITRWDVVYLIAEQRARILWDRKKNATVKSAAMSVSFNGQLVINQNF